MFFFYYHSHRILRIPLYLLDNIYEIQKIIKYFTLFTYCLLLLIPHVTHKLMLTKVQNTFKYTLVHVFMANMCHFNMVITIYYICDASKSFKLDFIIQYLVKTTKILASFFYPSSVFKLTSFKGIQNNNANSWFLLFNIDAQIVN